VQFEDQVSPKKCGHELGRTIVTIDEMAQRLRAAVEGRRDPDTLSIARTDARTTHGLADAIRRGRAYAQAGADIIFVESPESEAELREVAASLPTPTLANMVETGRTPYLSAERLGELGFAIAIYPATAFLAATHAVRGALTELRRAGRIDDLSRLATLEEYHEVLRFADYARLESKLSERIVDDADAG
jgi:2-methylisocitrate lyase-like PEP mutase family enzyme